MHFQTTLQVNKITKHTKFRNLEFEPRKTIRINVEFIIEKYIFMTKCVNRALSIK